ncbi:MAG: hypothetical protein IT379_02245 [Deltaproteobacteria bacterium]|nr:hypothetical protein [Deltaproteobacteria bacterium]
MGWWIAGAVVLAVGLAVWAIVAWRHVRIAECPKTGQRVRLRVVADPHTGWWSDVSACSAFDRSERVTCGKSCIATCSD